jgi:hypothetical protein
MTLHDPASPVFVSMTESATATACTRVNVADVLTSIRSGVCQARVQQVRNALATSGKDAADEIKKTLPGVLFSGEFTARRKSGLVRHSGLICADVDHISDPAALRDQLATDAHCVAAFLSPSGQGVKALFVVDATRPHAESWRAVNAHCQSVHGVEIDPACKDVSRLCFMSFDPDMYIAAGEVACVDYPPAPEPAAPVAADTPPDAESGAAGLLSPGDDYNQRGDVAAVLRKHGWTSADGEEWTRPGKENGLSATLGRLDDHPRGFFNFSSNAAPFAANEVYQPWHVFALLECGGDFNAAACELRKLGFGAPPAESLGPIYFDGLSYWRLERDGRFGRLGRTDVQLHLKMQGHSSRTPKGVEISAMDRALFEIQRANRFTYAAPFCGRPVGLYHENGNAVLATDSPTVIAPGEGDLGPLEDFFRNLLGQGQDEHADTQFNVFVGWLQRLRRALANPGQHLPGQALFLIGPASCGKTLAQTLITRLAGGRAADPSGWIFKNADFNDGLWGAEVLNLSDANVEDVSGARRKLRDRLKQLVANDIAPCHRKHRGEISLRPIWRVVVSANPDADSATVIPALDESVADKVIYLKCYLPPVPFPTDTEEGAANFFNGLIAAAPPFLSATEGFDVPAELRGVRFGVREFHHPAIVDMLAGVHPDAELADLIEEWLPTCNGISFSGSAVSLFEELDTFHVSTFVKTCRSPLVLSQALRRLSHVKAWSERVTSARVGLNKTTVWTIRKSLPEACAA